MDDTFVNSTRLQFRTPYFEIEVGETADKTNKLPHLLHRLADSVQITQTMENCSKIMATITFIEGSREPFNTLNENTNSLYQSSDGSIISNSAGMLADLVFAGNGGAISFTNISSIANAATEAVSNVASLASSFNSKLIEFNPTPSKKVKGSRYVFKEGNFVKVVWGYKENKSPAAFLGQIKVIQYEFPESEAAKMILTVESFSSTFDQIAAYDASPFFNKKPAGVDEAGNQTLKLEGLKSSEILKKLAADADFDLIISDSFEAELAGKDANHVWPAGLRFTQLLAEFAKKHNAVSIATFNPKTSKPTLIFTRRTDFFGTEILPSKLFRWRGQDSIIKSLAIRFDYGSLSGAGVVGIGNDGVPIKSATEQPVDVLMAEKKATIDTSTGTNQNGVNNLKKKVGNKQVGTTTYQGPVPAANAQAFADSAATCPINNAIALEITTLGHPGLRPGTITITGLANRYDAPYFIKVCEHKLSSEGYVCNITAMGHLTANGSVHPDSVNIQKKLDDEKIDIQLAVPQTTNSSATINNKTSEAIKGS